MDSKDSKDKETPECVEHEEVEETEPVEAESVAKKDKKKKKKRSKKKKRPEGWIGCEEAIAESKEVGPSLEQQMELIEEKTRALKIRDDRPQLEEAGDHRFWDTQPVPKLDEAIQRSIQEVGPMDEPKTVAEVRKEPYPLPEGYEWITCNIDDEETSASIYKLLNENYVEDDDAMFRFDYPKEFLQWALKPPGFRRDWHVGVRNVSSNELVGFVTGIPAQVRVLDKVVEMAEINFLCVHKRLRAKRLAPVLIKEVTRRVNLCDIWQAVYTAGVRVPTPFAVARYWHRPLNPEKLIDVGFSAIPYRYQSYRNPMQATKNHYRLPRKPTIPGIRPFEKSDSPAVRKLLAASLSRHYATFPVFSDEEIAHWMTPRKNVIYAYVVEDPKTKEITDFVSFYNLPSSVLGNANHTELRAAYAFYYACHESRKLEDLFYDALIYARANDFDVFNALDIMNNSRIFESMKFGVGDGDLHYYFYNYKFPQIAPSLVGVVLM